MNLYIYILCIPSQILLLTAPFDFPTTTLRCVRAAEKSSLYRQRGGRRGCWHCDGPGNAGLWSRQHGARHASVCA